MKLLRSRLLSLLLLVGLALSAGNAAGAVRYKGVWPDSERITLSLTSVPAAEAVRQLAERGGWNLVAVELGQERISIEVREISSQKLLETLLASGDYEVEREGQTVAIRRIGESAASASSAAANAPNQVVHTEGEPVTVVGDVTIGEHESVGDVLVWRGNAVVAGDVHGSVVVFGGNALVQGKAKISEDLIAFGGNLAIENGAHVQGDVAPVFGSLKRGSDVHVECTTCSDRSAFTPANYWRDTLNRIVGIAILWLVGSATIALGFRRVELLRRELAERPGRCLAIGLAAVVFVLALTGALFITLIGIPIAILFWIVLGSAIYLGAAVVLLALGQRLFRGRNENPYAQLAVGCAVLAVASLIPLAPGLLYFALGLLSLGGLFATRGAGLFGLRPRG